jgi:superfamily II DNA/RNA helicase
MIIDEADLTLDNLVSFDHTTLLMNGLVHLKDAQKVIYMSATMSKYINDVIKNCFGPFDH